MSNNHTHRHRSIRGCSKTVGVRQKALLPSRWGTNELDCNLDGRLSVTRKALFLVERYLLRVVTRQGHDRRAKKLNGNTRGLVLGRVASSNNERNSPAITSQGHSFREAMKEGSGIGQTVNFANIPYASQMGYASPNLA